LRTRYLRTALLFALALVLALGVAACGSKKKSSSAAVSGQPGKGKPAVKLGTKNFPESFILGQLYKQALEARGFKVQFHNSIGSTEIIDKALTSGQIDAYPEYTGESAVTVAGINTIATSPQQEYNLAKGFYAKRGQSMSAMTPFFDTDAIAVTKAYAAKYGLKTTADLKKIPHFTLGARPEFQGRQQGAVGIQKVYGVNNFTFKSLALGLQYQALDSGAINAADVFTTDPQLASGKYVVLTDPKHIFGFQNVAPIVSKKVTRAYGLKFAKTVNAVSAKLTLKAMIAMNKAVIIDKQSAAKVASAFLKANHLK